MLNYIKVLLILVSFILVTFTILNVVSIDYREGQRLSQGQY